MDVTWNPFDPAAEYVLPLDIVAPRHFILDGDLFDPVVPETTIAAVFGVMLLAHQHTFAIPTVHAHRMRHVLSKRSAYPYPSMEQMARNVAWNLCNTRHTNPVDAGADSTPWPLANVWLGVRASDQQEADSRVPVLLDTPAAVRFAQLEPTSSITLEMIVLPEPGPDHDHDAPGRVDPTVEGFAGTYNAFTDVWSSLDAGTSAHHAERCGARLDWVTVSGQTGPHARPLHPHWVRALARECETYGVPFGFAGWGEWAEHATMRGKRVVWLPMFGRPVKASQVARFPHPDTVARMVRVGAEKSGRTVDGRETPTRPDMGRS